MTRISTLNTQRWLGLSANAILFYGMVPALLGIVFAGLTYPQLSAAQWPVYEVQIYSVAVVFTGWLIRDGCCAVLAYFVRDRGLSLITVLIAGALVANVVIFPFSISFQTIFENMFIPEDLHQAHLRWAPLLSFDPGYLRDAVINHILPALFLWTTINLAFFHLLGLPRYGYPQSQIYRAISQKSVDADVERPATSTVRAHPSFMTLVPEKHQHEQVVAVKAEQHYVRVYTRLGDDLIHERFRSVVSEYEHFGGVQVHRSFAIHPDFIQGIMFENGQATIALVNGLSIPVSRSYTAIARKLKDTLAVAPSPSV